MMLRLIIAILLAGCGSLKLIKPKHPNPVDRGAVLAEVYESRLADYNGRTTHQSGWPSVTDCDATLWAGEACAGGASINIALAEHAPGEIHRRPHEACWSEEKGDVGSKTTVSRDMFTGYLACLWERRDVEALKRVAHFGQERSWVMGSPGSNPTTWLMPNLTGLLARMLHKVTDGADDRLVRHWPYDYASVSADYEEHIQVVGIYLQGDVSGGITEDALSRLRELAALRPTDYLFQAVFGIYTGNLQAAVELLLDQATPRPSYVRGDSADLFEKARWLFAARIVLKRLGYG